MVVHVARFGQPGRVRSPVQPTDVLEGWQLLGDILPVVLREPEPATPAGPVKCKEHPTYAARRHPVKTQKYPDGCPTCWGIWEHAKTDKKRLANTVSVEFGFNEARTLLMALVKTKPAPALERLYQLAAHVSPVEARALTNSLLAVYAQLEQLKVLLAAALRDT